MPTSSLELIGRPWTRFHFPTGKLLMIYICNFHVLSHLLLIYICKLHWTSATRSTFPAVMMLRSGCGVWTLINLRQYTVVSTVTSVKSNVPSGNLLLIYICIFHVLSHLLMNFICKLHWNLNTMFVCQVNYFWFTYVISMS